MTVRTEDNHIVVIPLRQVADAFKVIDDRITEQENLGRHIFKSDDELHCLQLLRNVLSAFSSSNN